MRVRAESLKIWAFAVVIAIIYYCISMFLLDLNILGDQEHYHRFYYLLKGSDLTDIIPIQVATLSGPEPVYGLFMWVGANLDIAKNQYIALFNSFLALCLFVLLKKNRVSFVLIILILTNYYFIVLLTSAERLKFSYIFLINAAIFSSRLRYFFLTLALFSHFQTLINYASITFGLLRLPSFQLVKFSRKKFHTFVLGGFVIATILFILVLRFSSFIIIKGETYYNNFEIMSIINLLSLMAVGLFITKKRPKFLMGMFPILFAAALLGPSRVNMIGFVMFFYFLMKEGEVNHLLMYPLLMYFSIKSYTFVLNIIVHGNGYFLLS